MDTEWILNGSKWYKTIHVRNPATISKSLVLSVIIINEQLNSPYVLLIITRRGDHWTVQQLNKNNGL